MQLHYSLFKFCRPIHLHLAHIHVALNYFHIWGLLNLTNHSILYLLITITVNNSNITTRFFLLAMP